MAKNTYGGIRISDPHQFNAKYVCATCSLLLYKPYQLSCCGALICEGCRADEQPFICSNCKMKQPTRQAILDRAVDREMKTLHVGCFNCKWTGIYEDYLKHLEDKHKDFQCEQCRERFFSRNSYRKHQLETCEHRRLSCGLPNCETSIKHSEMHKHYLSATHQNILNKTIVKSRHRKRTDYRSIREMHGKAASILNILNNEHARIKTEFGRERTNFDKNKSEIDQLRIVQKQTNEQFQNLFNNFTNMQTQIQQIKQSDILTLDSNASTIISYVYPTNAKVSTFQTSEYGYRFSVRLSTTIIQQNEFLSLTVNLLNGDYNNILPFPFSYNIHFILCDQSSKHEDFSFILKPDRYLSAFIRPTSESNEDISILDFYPMEKLTNKYVQDGKFFIRIFVDFLNSI